MVDELQESPVLARVLGDALPRLERFHDKLSQEGEPRGLIGPRDVDIIWERHILNSAAIVPYVRKATDGARFRTVADVGSGGGFPGLVTACCLPECSFTLIEPMERRVEWLAECVDLMGLKNVSIIRQSQWPDFTLWWPSSPSGGSGGRSRSGTDTCGNC